MKQDELSGQNHSFKLLTRNLNKSEGGKRFDMKCSRKRMTQKNNKVLHLLNRNVAVKVKIFLNLGLRKSLILPFLHMVLYCVSIKCGEFHLLDQFRMKCLKRRIGNNLTNYINQLRFQKFLPLSTIMYDKLLLCNFVENKSEKQLTNEQLKVKWDVKTTKNTNCEN